MNGRVLAVLTVALAIHVVALVATDQSVELMPVFYGGLVLGLAGAARLLRAREGSAMAAGEHVVNRFAETLIFVGVGYCTSEGPGVVKLFGVVPMGWVGAVLSLLAEHFLVLRRSASRPWLGASVRMMALALGVLLQAVSDPPWGVHRHDANWVLVGLMLASGAALLDLARLATTRDQGDSSGG